ncbi:MAG TPA: hypothetical protein DEP42_05275 [Ruminococcaceae bacterium]|nr:hypothetical protein [Oscillospiraceae bacterium]
MDEKKRIKQLRHALGLTQIQFSKRTGMSQTSLSSIENGSQNVTNKTRKVICAEFGVREIWLHSGTGEIFEKKSGSTLDILKKEYDADNSDLQMIKAYLKLDHIEKQAIKKYIISIAKALTEPTAN